MPREWTWDGDQLRARDAIPLAAVVGGVVGYDDGWAYGLLAFCGLGALPYLLWYIFSSARWLPADALTAAGAAVMSFRGRYPSALIRCVWVRAVEDDRYVIAISHQPGRRTVIEPGPRAFFAVDRPNHAAVTELNTEDWLPQVWK